MIRPVKLNDRPGVLKVAEESGLFQEHELAEFESILDNYFSGEAGTDDTWVIADSNGSLGVAYYAPENFASGVWNLYFIAVDEGGRGSGIGRQILEFVQNDIADKKARILIVETSGLDRFESTRAFYRRNAFHEVGRIPEYYGEGDAKVIFYKAITRKDSRA